MTQVDTKQGDLGQVSVQALFLPSDLEVSFIPSSFPHTVAKCSLLQAHSSESERALPKALFPGKNPFPLTYLAFIEVIQVLTLISMAEFPCSKRGTATFLLRVILAHQRKPRSFSCCKGQRSSMFLSGYNQMAFLKHSSFTSEGRRQQNKHQCQVKFVPFHPTVGRPFPQKTAEQGQREH